MKLKLEYLAGCGTFSECRFRTPFYEKEVSGLAFICRSGTAVWEPQSLLLVCAGLIPGGGEQLVVRSGVLCGWLLPVRLGCLLFQA